MESLQRPSPEVECIISTHVTFVKLSLMSRKDGDCHQVILPEVRNYTNLVNRYFVFVILAKHSFHCAKLPHRLIYIHFLHQSQETLKIEISIPC